MNELQKITPDLDNSTLNDRFRVCGGIPRYIVDDVKMNSVIEREVARMSEREIYTLAESMSCNQPQSLSHVSHRRIRGLQPFICVVLATLVEKVEMSTYVNAVDFIISHSSSS